MLEAFDAGTLDAVAQGIGKDLATAANDPAGSGRFQVDLQALHDYYYRVYELWSGLNQYAQSLPEDPYAMQCVATSRIPGVQDAIQATVEGALSPSESMRGALTTIRGNLATHLTALHDAYVAYVNTDEANATTLTAAGDPEAANVAVNLRGGDSDIPGWANSILHGPTA